MENTQLAFLTSLGGKLSGEKAAGNKSVAIGEAPAGESAESERNGFFAILNRLLTAGATEAGAGQAVLQPLQGKLPESDEAASDIPLVFTTEPVEGVPDVALAEVTLNPASENVEGDALDANSLGVVAQGEAFTSVEAKPSVSAPAETRGTISVKPGTAASSVPLATGVKTVVSEAATPGEQAEPELSADLDGKRQDNRVFTGAGQPQAKPAFGAPQLPQAAQKGLPDKAQAENAILSAGVDGESPAIERSAVTRADSVALTTGKTISINPIRDQVIAAVVARSNEGRLEVRLDPPELGRVTINFEGDGAELVRAVISADTPETLDLMRRNADAFQRALAEQGFEGLHLEFTQSGAENAEGDEQKEEGRAFALGHDADISSRANEEEPGARARLVELGRLDRRL